MLDDLHWADAASVDLVGYLLRHRPEPATLLAAALRPAQAPDRLRLATDPAGAPDLLLRTPASPCDVRTNDSDAAIRDRGTGTSTIGLTGCSGRATWASVEVHIEHPRRGDLVIDLVAPNGSVKRLKPSNRNDRAPGVDATYAVKLSVKDRAGTWKLRVRDTTRGATGHVDSWTLTVA
jgi:hypothetical protein